MSVEEHKLARCIMQDLEMHHTNSQNHIDWLVNMYEKQITQLKRTIREMGEELYYLKEGGC